MSQSYLNEQTARFRYNSFPSSIESFKIMVGFFTFQVNDSFIILENNYDITSKDFKNNFGSLKLLHFNESEIRSIWISYKITAENFDETFIKIGIGYTYSENTIYEFRTRSEATLYLFNQIKNISLSDDTDVVEKICIENSITHNPLPVLNPTFKSNINYLDSRQLNKDGRKLFAFMTSIDMSMKDEELNAIQYSIENEGCSLNLLIDGNLSSSILVSYISNDNFTSFLKIIPSGHHLAVRDQKATTVLSKVIEGAVDYQWYNPLDEGPSNFSLNKLFKKGDISWATQDYYQTYEISNFDSNAAILLKVQEKKSENINYDYKQLLSSTFKEYRAKSCDTEKTCSCLFEGFRCGFSIKSLSNKCNYSIESQGIYSCIKATRIPKLTKICSHKCISSKKTSCKDKPQVYSKISPYKSNSVFGSLTIEDTESAKLNINGVLFGLYPSLSYNLIIHEKNDNDIIKEPFDPLYIGINNIGKLEINQYGSSYIKASIEFFNTKPSNLFNILNRIIAVRLNSNDSIVASGVISYNTPLNVPETFANPRKT